jgi:O-antigen/teichoic acid export membrane protein
MTDRQDQDDRLAYLTHTLPMPAIDVADVRAQPDPPGPPTAAAPAAEQVGLARVAKGGVLNLGGALVSAIATLGLTVIVTRHFSRPVAGAFFVAMSLFLIVEAVANLGAYNGTIYFIARLRALHADRRIPAILRATIVPVVISSAVAAAALIIFASPLARLLLDDKSGPAANVAAAASALRALALALPFAALADTLLGAARGFHEMRPTVLVDRIGRSGLQAIGVLAVALAGSSALLAPVWALPYLGACVVSAFWLRRIMRAHRRRLAAVASRDGPAPHHPTRGGAVVDNRHGKPNAKGFWGFTGPRSLASVAQIIIQRLDIVLVGVLKGPVDAAIYTAATRFLVAGQLGNAAISMAAQPQLTRLFAVGDRAGANSVYQATTAWLILLTWPLYLLAAIFGPKVLVIFGRSYHAGSTVMLILALAMLVATGCGQVDTVLITTGRSSWSLINGLMAMGVNIGVDLALIPRYGITGAAIGWAAAIGITNLVPLVQVATAARVHPFGAGTAAACLITTLSFAIIPIAARELAGDSALVAVASVAAGCVVMVCSAWLLRWTLELAVLPWASLLRGRPGGRREEDRVHREAEWRNRIDHSPYHSNRDIVHRMTGGE